MPGRMRHRAERIGLAVMALLGIAVLGLDLTGLLDQMGSAIPRITLLIVSTVTIFLLMEVERFQALDRLDNRLALLDVEEKAKQLKDKQYAGLVKVHDDLADIVFCDYVRSARTISILNTWIPNLRALLGALVMAANRGAEVRILLLDPYSDAAKLRSSALQAGGAKGSGDRVMLEVRNCIADLAEARERIRAENRDRLQVKLYNSHPSISVYRADDHYLVGMFLHKHLAINLPQFEVDGGDTVLGNSVRGELDTLWNRVGRDLDLENWENQLESMMLARQPKGGVSDGRPGPVRRRLDRAFPRSPDPSEPDLAEG
jgi:hypothetical protein